MLRSSRIGLLHLLRSILNSHEFLITWTLPVKPLDALHIVRIQLVQEHLPPASVVVDLGGASNGNPEGALLTMGYPYTPAEVVIVDLPVGQRYGEWEANEAQEIVTARGTRVRYLFRSMADLSPFRDNSVDLVWSGESIEHVSEEDADRVIAEARRVLKPGGYFCLDTPNRAVTRLLSPDSWTHPEHYKEYEVEELVRKLERGGFVSIESKSLCPVPASLARGVLDWAELTGNIRIGDNAEEGYLFFIKGQKPPHV